MRDYSMPRKTSDSPIARARMSRGLTQEDLALIIGCDKRQVSFWETNRVEVKVSTLVKIAKALGVDINELIDIKAPKESTMQTIRREKGITQAELAKAVGCSRATISTYETGAVRMSPERKAQIAEILGVSVESLD